MKRMKLLFTLALPVLLLQNAQAQLSRITGQSHWYNNGVVFVPQDTTHYNYNNPNFGGDLNNTIKFSTANTWVATDTSLAPSLQWTQDFWSTGNIKSQTKETYNTFSGAFSNTSKFLYWYNTNNSADYTIYQTWGGSSWTNVNRTKYDYSGTALSTTTYQHWFGADFFTDSIKNSFYNTANLIKQETFQDSAAGAFVNTKKYDYTYDTAHATMVASVTKSNYSGSGYTPSWNYQYTYDAAGNRTQSIYSVWNTTTSAWDAKYLHSYSMFTSSHLPQVDEYYTYDTAGGGTWKHTTYFTYAYNSHDQMTSMTGESYNALGFPEYAYGDPMARYYYESYTVGVNDVAAANGEVNIFPNPAQNLININLKWNNAQAFTVSIFNMNGAIVRQWNVASTAAYTTSIPTESLATGTYVVRISGAEGQISRQVVVAH